MGTRGVCSQISYESETCLFPVQRGELYGSPELPRILSGSARYPVQRVPGYRGATVLVFSSCIRNWGLVGAPFTKGGSERGHKLGSYAHPD